MKKNSTLTVALAALTVAGLFSAACGDDKFPEPKTATNAKATPAATATSKQSVAEKVNNSPTASAVNIAPEILKACGIPEPEAFFAFDSSALRPEDTAPLDKVATCFISGPLKGRGLRIVGHADPRGGAEYNMVLGQSRADAVSNYVKGKGLDKAKIDTTSRGALDATGNDEQGYAKDRRVDVMLGQ